MLTEHRQQDITPSSARRSDGDTRFQLIPSESFWSQGDVAGGYGRVSPHDPTMFWKGPADTLEGAVRSAFQVQGEFTSPAAGAAVVGMASLGTLVYVAVNDAGTGKLYTLSISSAGVAAWALLGNLSSPSVTSMVAFRGDVWLAYGSAANVQYWDSSALAFAAPATAFAAQVLCPYASMLFHVRYDSATQTWRINRYDPENTGAVSDLAIVPVGNEISDYMRAMVALGADLFLVGAGTLWKFTSQNGNSGVLVGPVDSWLPYGGLGTRSGSGRAAVAFQGALLYAAGGAIRRHQPGGGARQIWPVPPNRHVADAVSNFDDAGLCRTITAMAVSADRVWIASAGSQVDLSASTGHSTRLLCWTGAGMHHVATQNVSYGSTPTVRASHLAIDGNGVAFVAVGATGTPSSGKQLGWFGLNGTGLSYREATTTLYTSVLDFGMADLDKVITTAYVYGKKHNSTPGIALAIVDFDTGDETVLTASGAFSATTPTYVTFTSATPLVGKRFYFKLTLTTTGSTIAFGPEVYHVACIPNPVYPVRYGFRVVIPAGTHVRLHDGNMAYADQAAVDAALAYCRTLRASSYPFTLDWIDGVSYTVRCNTISIARDKLRPDESAWVVTLDLQEISGE